MLDGFVKKELFMNQGEYIFVQLFDKPNLQYIKEPKYNQLKMFSL